MMVHLTPEQMRQLAGSDEPLKAFDPLSGKAYRIIAEESYVQIRALLEDRAELRDFYPLVDAVLRREESDDEPDYSDLGSV